MFEAGVLCVALPVLELDFRFAIIEKLGYFSFQSVPIFFSNKF